MFGFVATLLLALPLLLAIQKLVVDCRWADASHQLHREPRRFTAHNR